MLRELRIRNFKSWSSADVKLGPVTGFFGSNSSGKTSLLQFLLLLKQTKEATDRNLALHMGGDYVDLGTYADIIHGHDEKLPLEWSLSFELPKELSIVDPDRKRTDPLVKTSNLQVNGSVESRHGAPRARQLSYAAGDHVFSLALKGDGDSGFVLQDKGPAKFHFKRTLGRKWELPGPVKSYAFPDQARTYYQNAGFLADLESGFESQMDRLFYLGPLREYPRRQYLWRRSRPTDVGKRGENAIEAIIAATNADERGNLRPKARLMRFQELIAHWLHELGLIHSFSVGEIRPGSNLWQARVVVSPGGPEVLLTDVGFGVSQVLPVVTLLYYVPEGATVILEQPEIHLHPLAQAQLADVVISVAKHRNVQVLVESHSEHFLLRLQRRIAEAEVDSDFVRLYFCSIHGGASDLTSLDVDMFGNIGNWPDRFMGDAFGEVAAAEKARIKRTRAAE